MVQCTFAEHQNPEKSINLDFETKCRESMQNNNFFLLLKGFIISPMSKLAITFPKYIYTCMVSVF
jgi:hypothetical protein